MGGKDASNARRILLGGREVVGGARVMDFGSEFNIIKESKTKRHRRLNLIEQPGYLVRVHADPCGVGGVLD